MNMKYNHTVRTLMAPETTDPFAAACAASMHFPALTTCLYTSILYLSWITKRPQNKKLQLQQVIQLQPWIKAQGHHCFGDNADTSQELCKLQKKDTTVNMMLSDRL